MNVNKGTYRLSLQADCLGTLKQVYSMIAYVPLTAKLLWLLQWNSLKGIPELRTPVNQNTCYSQDRFILL